MEQIMIEKSILKLVDYALATGLIERSDVTYTINRLLELFELDEIDGALVQEWEEGSRMSE